MKNLKQLQLILSIIFMALTSLTAYGQNPGNLFTVGNLQYKTTSATKVEVVDYIGTITEVTIPSTVDHGPNTYMVTSIGGYAFQNNQLTEVIIPNTVTSIGEYAFRNNQLTEVTIPNSVTSIGAGAFSTNQLIGVTIPNSVTSIGIAAFNGNHLTEVTIPNSVTSIGEHAFQNNQLTGVTIPNSVTNIGFLAFSFNQLTEVIIPASVTNISYGAFWNNRLTEVIIPNSVTSIREDAFGNNRLTEVIIPNSVTSIGRNAFGENPNLAMVIVKPSNPPALHPNAFQNPGRDQIDVVVPKGTRQVYLDNNYWTDFRSITEVVKVDDIFIADNITYGVTALGSPNMVTAIGYDIAGGTSVTIPETVDHGPNTYTVTAIGNEAFKEKGLTSVAIPNSVTDIGEDAFWQNQLTSVEIPTSVTSIGQRAFGTNKLDSVTIPNSVTSIGQWVFAANQLTEVTIPANVESIGYQAFYNNPLSLVRVERNVPPTLDAFAFVGVNNTDLRHQIDLVVPRGNPAGSIKTAYETAWGTDFKSITEIAGVNDTFSADHITYRVTSLTPYEVEVADYTIMGGPSVNIPPTVDYGPNTYAVTAIGNEAFKEKGLTSVTIPNSVTSIGLSAFRANQLESVVIPDDVTMISTFAFRENQLSGITLGANVDQIGYGAFRFNELTNVVIPNGVTSIGGEAFANNPITKVTAQGVGIVPTIVTAHTFSNRHQIDVVVPKGKVQAYLDNGWTDFRSITEPAEVGGTFIADHITYKVTFLAPLKVEATDYNTAGGPSVNIPSTVDHGPNTYTVTSIGKSAFENNQLASVTIPNSVIGIGEDAFWKNQLTSVEIPTSVTSIEQRAFGTNLLDSVTIPDGLTSIDQWVFAANQLTEVTIPANVESIGYQAFYNNPNLGLVTVKANDPPGLDANAFQGTHSDLRHQIDLVVPKDKRQDYLDHNEWTVFRSITEVVEAGDTFTVDQIIYKVTSLNPYKVEAENYIIGGDTALIIPPTVDHGLNTYTVTSIGEFSGFWPYLVSLVRVEADNPPMLPPTSFPGRSEVDVIVPEGKKQDYINAGWTDFRSITEPYDVGNTFTNGRYTYLITSSNPQTVKAIDYTGTASTVNIPGIVNTVKGPFTVTAIGNEVFKDKGLTSVAIPNSVTSIGDHAFSGNQLTEVIIPNNVTSIGEWAFGGNLLTEVTIPNNVDSIGEGAFFGNELTRVTIGNSITSIGEGAFAANQDLVVVWMKATDAPTLHGSNTFPVWTYKINLFVPPGSNGYGTGEGRWNDYFVNIFVNPPQVGNLLYLDMKYKVTFLNPNEVEVAPYNNIMGGAVTIPPTVDYFGFHTYTVTAIAGRAFYNVGLTSVTIPNSVTSIEEGAFENNPNLETVTVKATNPPSLHPNAFQNADRNQIDLIVPIGKRQKYLDNGWDGFRSITEAAIAATQSSSAWGASTVKSEVAPAHSNKGNELENFTVYPNPVQDRIHIRLSDGEALQQVNIYNTQGVHVYSANTLQIDISHLSGGMYMLEIETKAGKRVVKRVIVK